MKVYITSIGKTGINCDFLAPARDEFGFDHAVLLVSENHLPQIQELYPQQSLVVMTLQEIYSGNDNYVKHVKSLCLAAVALGASQCIVSTSGGTEKMACILRDAAELLARALPVQRVMGLFDKENKSVKFTTRPSPTEIESTMFGTPDYQI